MNRVLQLILQTLTCLISLSGCEVKPKLLDKNPPEPRTAPLKQQKRPFANHPYFRTQHATSGKPIVWKNPKLTLRLYTGRENRWDKPWVHSALQTAVDVWSDGCSSIDITIELVHGERGRAVRDGSNSIVFREDLWCRPGARSKRQCYPEDIAALTQVWAKDDNAHKEAELTEADIQINAVHFSWEPGDLPASKLHANLARTFTHELGHFLGLEHRCARRWHETLGRLPRCQKLPERAGDATMHPLYPNERGLPKLGTAERAFLCDVYKAQ